MQYPGPLTDEWTPRQRAWFAAAYSSWDKDEAAGVLLAFFLGGFGAHHFYLRQNGLGVLYLVFFWTGIPALIALVECFFMPARVRRYNWELAAQLTAQLTGGAPGPAPEPYLAQRLALPSPSGYCVGCGEPITDSARFCGRCGRAL